MAVTDHQRKKVDIMSRLATDEDLGLLAQIYVYSKPGIFTLNGSGQGQGAILNQDYSVNGPSNPASRGSAVMVYATGFGASSPICVDGKIYQDVLPIPVLPVIAGIANQGAQVLYAGASTGYRCGRHTSQYLHSRGRSDWSGCPDNAEGGRAI